MSILSYRPPDLDDAIVLPYPYSTQFTQDAIYDDQGGVEAIYTRFDIQVTTLINKAYLGMLAPDLVGGGESTQNPAEIMNVVRSRLLTPRGQLSFECDGHQLIPQPQQDPESSSALIGTVDAKNGPQPQSCNITRLTNTTFLMTYRIIAHYHECNSIDADGFPIVTNLAGNHVLFNRWTETVDIDRTNYSTRTRQGKFTMRSDNFEGKLADQLRSQMAVVGVPNNFLRESSNYTISADGLSIAYRLADKEVFRLPPNPSFEASGEYVETSSIEGGPMRRGEIRLKLRGERATNNADLSQTALNIATAKFLNLNRRAAPASAMLMLDLYDQTVEVRIAALMDPGFAAGNERTGNDLFARIWGFKLDDIWTVPGTAWQPTMRDRGSASWLLMAAAMYDPCLTATIMDKDKGQLTKGFEIGKAGLEEEDLEAVPTTSPLSPDNPLSGTQTLSTVTMNTATIDPAAFSDTSARYVNFDQSSISMQVFTAYEMTSRLEKDGHIYMGGMTSPGGLLGQTAAFVQLAVPTLLKIVEWDASKLGNQPEIPDPRLANEDANWVLLDEWPINHGLKLAADGVTVLYEMSGVYVYGHRNPAALTIQNAGYPAPPWLIQTSVPNFGAVDRTVPVTKLEPGLIS